VHSGIVVQTEGKGADTSSEAQAPQPLDARDAPASPASLDVPAELARMAKIIVTQAQAIKQLQDLYTQNMSAIIKRLDDRDARRSAGPDWLNDPTVKATMATIGGALAKWLSGGTPEAGRRDIRGIVSDAAWHRIEDALAKQVEAEASQVVEIVNALKDGRVWVQAGKPPEEVKPQ